MKRLLYTLITLATCIQAFGQSITVTSPNGQEVWNTGTSQTITWTSQSVTQVKIEYSYDWGTSWFTVIASTPATGSYNWTVSSQPSLYALVRVSDAGNAVVNDVSDGYFKVGPVAQAFAGNDTAICPGGAVQLQATSSYYDNPGGGGPPPPPPGATYSWWPATGLSSANIANPVASPAQTTMYFVTANYNGVIAEDTVVVYVQAVDITPSITNVSCNGGNTGSICANVQSGGPFVFTWSNNAVTQCITNLTAGVYSVTVQNGIGCSDTASFTVQQPTPLSLSTSHSNASCSTASNGSVCALPSGGVAPYAYLWSPNIFTSCSNNIPPGNYSLLVTDANGCTISSNETVSADSLTLTVTPQAGCENKLCASVTGGAGAISYAWANGASASCASWLPGNGWAITVTDNGGCSAVLAGSSVNEAGGFTATLSVTDAACAGAATGAVVATPNGGNAPYSYNIYNALTQQQFGTLQNLPGGTYVVFTTDNTGCTIADTVAVAAPQVITVSYTTTASSCGLSNGSACLNVSGGTGPYQYNWNPTVTGSCSNSMAAGTYTVTILDNAGCSIDTSLVIQSVTLVLDSVVPVVGCENSVCAYVSGGLVPYTYTWSNGSTTQCTAYQPGLVYQVVVTDNGGCTATSTGIAAQATGISVALTTVNTLCYGTAGGSLTITATGATSLQYILENPFIQQTSPVFNNLAAGTYILRTVDANWCEHRDTFGIAEPAALVVDSVITTNPTCFGTSDGSACLYISGGNAPYAYNWLPFNSTTMCGTGMSPGIYTITVTDLNGCTITASATLAMPSQLSVSATVTNVACHGGSTGNIGLTATNGCGNYTYQWSNGLLDGSNLVAGNYTVTVVDACTCSVSAMFNVLEPAPLSVHIVNLGDSILPDTLQAQVTGGVAPYMYTWNGGNNTQTQGISVDGFYQVTVMDNNLCTGTDSIIVGCVNTCVWPGDANYDGLVDNTDLLPIGLGNGTNGTPRALQGNGWLAHSALDWADTLITGSNYKHIDCDGNGTINADDTAAIVQNYALTHPRNGGWDEWRSGAPALRIGLMPDTLMDGDVMLVTLSLGDSNALAGNVYGLAFTFNYDMLVVDSAEVNITFGTSWLCGTGDHIDLNKKFYSTGHIEAAVTRIDHTTRTGGGPIAAITMKITTGNINGKNLDYYSMLCSVTNVVMIDNQGNLLPVNATADSTLVEFEPATGILPVSNNHVLVYPNPAMGQLYISNTAVMENLQVINLLGETVLIKTGINAKSAVLDIASLDGGTYLLKIKTAGGEYFKRFIKTK